MSNTLANALLAEIMPTKHRGWCLVLIGGRSAHLLGDWAKPIATASKIKIHSYMQPHISKNPDFPQRCATGKEFAKLALASAS